MLASPRLRSVMEFRSLSSQQSMADMINSDRKSCRKYELKCKLKSYGVCIRNCRWEVVHIMNATTDKGADGPYMATLINIPRLFPGTKRKLIFWPSNKTLLIQRASNRLHCNSVLC